MVESKFEDFFSVQVFLIVLREILESVIIISVLLTFTHQSFIGDGGKKGLEYTTRESSTEAYDSTTNTSVEGSSAGGTPTKDSLDDSYSIYKFLRLQIWIGGLLGLVFCLLVGTVILSVFYVVGNDLWSSTEHYWEGTFSIVASIIISIMGVKILRVNKMQEKWKYKLSAMIQNSDYLNKAVSHHKSNKQRLTYSERISYLSEKYSMFILPFVTTMREGMEAIVFVGGIGINENTSIWAIVNAVVLAVIIGFTVGVLLYRSGNTLPLQWFLITSTGFLYLIAAGLFSKGVWNFELQSFIDACGGMDVSETGHGPGSYDITKSVWHVNCCNGELQEDGAFWMIFTAIFGWTNSATYGSIISYNIYWIIIILTFSSLIYEEKYGILPIVPIKWQKRRIKKRLRSYYTQLNTPESETVDTVRESIDSVDSSSRLIQ